MDSTIGTLRVQRKHIGFPACRQAGIPVSGTKQLNRRTIHYFCRTMAYKKSILTFLFPLFFCFSIHAFGDTFQKSNIGNASSEGVIRISQNSPVSNSEHFSSVEGILQLLSRVNESNNPTFQKLKNNKKIFGLHTFTRSDFCSKTCCCFLCFVQVKRIGDSPFYIAYHQLLI